jgi:F420-non-reducing hydrogenase iron-sulfur subunit
MGEDASLQAGQRIVAFLCNWCCYAAADAAGIARYQYPPNIRVVRLMCTGRVDALFLLHAFSRGADGVLVGGCALGDCHYQRGNYEAIRVVSLAQMMLEEVKVDPRRLTLKWASAAEAAHFAEIVTEFTKQVKEMGPLEPTRRPERAGLALKLRAAEAAAGSERLRLSFAKAVKQLNKGNVYDPSEVRSKLEELLGETVRREILRQEIVLRLGAGPKSVEELAQELNLPALNLDRHLEALKRKGEITTAESRGTTCLYTRAGRQASP